MNKYKSLAHSPSVNGGTKELERFKTLASEYSRLGGLAGVEMKPFGDPSLPYFRALEPDHKKTILEALEVCVRICSTTLSEGQALYDSKALTWQAIRTMKMRPPSDLFSYIDSDNYVIEIHSEQGTQIFRNFRFFDLCSYTLEELHCTHWSVLYGRDDPSVNLQLVELTRKVFSGEAKSTFVPGVTPHKVFELSSEKKFVIRDDIKYAAPLFYVGTSIPAATIVIEDADLVAPDARVTPFF